MFVFANDIFADVDAGDSLTFTAVQNDGSNLPAWLSFHGATRTFDGMPVLGDNDQLAVRVTATDTGGLNVDEVFIITVAPDPNPWQNPGLHSDAHMDVDDNANVAPLDVLTIINYVNTHGAGELPTPGSPTDVEHLYIDVNGDNKCTPLDVLELINFINIGPADGEGEAGKPDAKAPVFTSEAAWGPWARLPASVTVPSTNGQNALLQARQIWNGDTRSLHSIVGAPLANIGPKLKDAVRTRRPTLASQNTPLLSPFDEDLLSDFDHLLDVIASDAAPSSQQAQLTDILLSFIADEVSN